MEEIFDKLEVPPAYRIVAETIERNILLGKLKIGDRLPAEQELSRQLGVHRSTVREGIRLLEQSGLVARLGRSTLEITLPAFKQIGDRASRALSMHQVSFRELWEASMLTETAAVDMACAVITAVQLDELKENCRAMKKSAEDIDAFVKLDIEFHDLIANASQNRVFRLMREPISLLFLPAGRIILPRLKTQHRVIEAHEQIIEALSARNNDTAHQWMSRHMADFKRAYERTGLDLEAPMQTAGPAVSPTSDFNPDGI